jgi:hypothetical protein
MEGEETISLFLGDVYRVIRTSGLQPAHGVGLDGCPVHSFSFVETSKKGVYYFVDIHGNANEGTAHELIALLRKIEPGYDIIAVKKS